MVSCPVGPGCKLGSCDLEFDVVLLDALICLSDGEMKMIMPFIDYWEEL